MATYIRDCYTMSSRLFITGGCEISSSEGTTQGDPFAMPGYAVGIVPLLSMISLCSSDNEKDRTYQLVYTDDLAGGGKIVNLRS